MKNSNNNQLELANELKSGFEVMELEERLEMVQADALVSAFSCCMDSTETAPANP